MIQSDVGGTQNAMDKSFAGVKWRFYEESEQGWQISTYPQVEYATPYFAAVKKGLPDKKATSYYFLKSCAHLKHSIYISKLGDRCGCKSEMIVGLRASC